MIRKDEYFDNTGNIRRPEKYNKVFYEKVILDGINGDGYDVGKLETPEEKLQFLRDTFRSEYGFMIDRVGEQKAFEEWLMGLPSAIYVPFYNHDIIVLAKQGGSLPINATEKQEDKIIANYFRFMTAQVFRLFRKYRVN